MDIRTMIEIVLVLLLILLFAKNQLLIMERNHFIGLTEDLLQVLKENGLLKNDGTRTTSS